MVMPSIENTLSHSLCFLPHYMNVTKEGDILRHNSSGSAPNLLLACYAFYMAKASQNTF